MISISKNIHKKKVNKTFLETSMRWSGINTSKESSLLLLIINQLNYLQSRRCIHQFLTLLPKIKDNSSPASPPTPTPSAHSYHSHTLRVVKVPIWNARSKVVVDLSCLLWTRVRALFYHLSKVLLTWSLGPMVRCDIRPGIWIQWEPVRALRSVMDSIKSKPFLIQTWEWYMHKQQKWSTLKNLQ